MGELEAEIANLTAMANAMNLTNATNVTMEKMNLTVTAIGAATATLAKLADAKAKIDAYVEYSTRMGLFTGSVLGGMMGWAVGSEALPMMVSVVAKCFGFMSKTLSMITGKAPGPDAYLKNEE